MQLDHLSVQILKKIATEPGIPLKTLCQRIGLPQRNFYYRRTRINDWLVAEGLSPLLCDLKSGVRLNEADVEDVLAKLSVLHARNYKPSAKERRDLLLLHLACRTQPAFICHLSTLNYVSRNTTLDDLRGLKDHLMQQKLNLLIDRKQGYRIAGCDLILRLTVQQMFQHVLKYADRQAENRIQQALSSHLQTLGLETSDVNNAIDEELSLTEKHTGESFSDKDKRLLHYTIMLSLVDTLRGHIPHFTAEQTHFLREQTSCERAACLNDGLARRLKIPATANNTLFFSLLLSASKKVTPHQITVEADIRLMTAVKRLIQQFQALSGVYLQDTRLLESRLFSHLSPAIHRCLFGMRSENALKEDILQRYPLLFRLCRQVIVSLETEYRITICDDELSYIVISFAAWMDRRPETAEQHILMVTEGGQSSTALLENQLRNLTILPVQIEKMSASQLQQQGTGDHIRLVVSTVALSSPLPANVGFIRTQHMLSENEKQQLRLMLEQNNHTTATETGALVEALVASATQGGQQQKEQLHQEFSTIINQFFRNQQYRQLIPSLTVRKRYCYFNFTSSQQPWQQLIRKAAQPLREKNIIDAHYARNIVRQVEADGITSYLSPDILLLHDAPPPGATEGALSLLKLKHPLRFNLQNITLTPKVIVILVPTKALTHIPLLEALNALISHDETLERLLNANSRHELMGCIDDIAVFEHQV